jgi:hypothetical protein
MAPERRYALSTDIGPGCAGWAAPLPAQDLAGGAVASGCSLTGARGGHILYGVLVRFTHGRAGWHDPRSAMREVLVTRAGRHGATTGTGWPVSREVHSSPWVARLPVEGLRAGEPLWPLLPGADGSLEAGALLERTDNDLTSAADVYSGDGDAVAQDENARTELWEALGRVGENYIRLVGIPEQRGMADAAEAALLRASYRVVRDHRPLSPCLDSPTTWEELIQSVSKNLRSQWRRAGRALERQGAVAFRTVTRPPRLARRSTR